MGLGTTGTQVIMKSIQILDEVIELQKQKFSEINRIQNTQFRKIGLMQITMDPVVKNQMISKVSADYDRKIKSLYAELNAERTETGLNAIECPF